MDKEISIFTLIKDLTEFLKKNIYWYLAGILLAILITAAYSFSLEPTYECTMVANSDVISNYRVDEMFKSVEAKLEESDYAFIQEAFNLAEEEAKNIKGIEVTIVEEHPDYFDPSRPQFESNCFKVSMIHTKNDVDNLNLGVVHYISSNEFVNQLWSRKNELYEREVKDLENDLKTLKNELSQLMNQGEKGNSSNNKFDVFYGSESNFLLRNEINRVKRLQKFNEKVSVIDPFSCRLINEEMTAGFYIKITTLFLGLITAVLLISGIMKS